MTASGDIQPQSSNMGGATTYVGTCIGEFWPRSLGPVSCKRKRGSKRIWPPDGILRWVRYGNERKNKADDFVLCGQGIDGLGVWVY